LFRGLTRALFSKVDGHVNILSWADWTFEMSCYGLFSILRSFRFNPRILVGRPGHILGESMPNPRHPSRGVLNIGSIPHDANCDKTPG
jgi:hypothetical protein